MQVEKTHDDDLKDLVELAHAVGVEASVIAPLERTLEMFTRFDGLIEEIRKEKKDAG